MSEAPLDAARSAASPPASLADVLALEAMGSDHWRGYTPPGSDRPDIFGGQVASQCLRAAGLTIEGEHVPNSVHCYFLRRGRPDIPLDIHVERVRTGRTYASRRVEAVQDAKVIFTLISSFHAPEPGREFDSPAPVGVPDPDTLEPPSPVLSWSAPFDTRSVPSEGFEVGWWSRVRDQLGDEPVLQYCALLYASDMHAGGAAMRAAGLDVGPPPRNAEGVRLVNLGSLDHSVWFHRPPRMDDWVYFESRSVAVGDSRGLVLGTIHDRNGLHLATLSQEMFLKDSRHP